jgi:NRPS condensation-like uncharacterized protein
MKIPFRNGRFHLRSPSINVCFRLVIEGEVSKWKIGKAIEQVCEKHPLLNCCVELDQSTEHNVWFVKNKKGITVEHYVSGDIDWQTWYMKNDNIPFDLTNGPLLRICLITGKHTAASQSSEIVILGHHILGDGIGYLNLIKDILLSLDGKLDAPPLMPPFEAADLYFKQTILLEPGVKAYAEGLNEEWRKNRIQINDKDYHDFFRQYRDRFNPNLYMTSMQEDDLKRLSTKSKAYGFTVNEIIVSAFSLAAMEVLKKSEIRIGVAASIRNELISEPMECMGNYVTGISAKVNSDLAKNFILSSKAIAESIREQLLNPKSRHLAIHFLNEFDKDLLELIPMAAHGSLEHKFAKKLGELIGENSENKGLGFTNLGRHDFHNYDNFKIMDIQFIGPAFPANLLTVGVITVNNRLNICLRFNETEISTDCAEAICRKAILLLKCD